MILYILHESDNIIVQELENTYTIEVINPENFCCENCTDEVMGLIIECNNFDCMTQQVKDMVNMFLMAGKSVVLLDVNSTVMKYLIGMSVECSNAVVQPHMGNQYIVNCIDDCAPTIRYNGGQAETYDSLTDTTTPNNTMPGFGDQAVMQVNMSMQECAQEISNMIVNEPTTTLLQSQNFAIANNDIIAKNPSFMPMYSLTNSYTTSIRDFEIVNRSRSDVAEWIFQLGITQNDIKDVFSFSSFDSPDVKELPSLATQNLQPYCSSTWFVENTNNDTIPFRVSANVAWYHAYVVNKFASYKYYWDWWNWQKYMDIEVNFGEVNP